MARTEALQEAGEPWSRIEEKPGLSERAPSDSYSVEVRGVGLGAHRLHGAHHISRKHSAQYERAQRKYAAQMAAALNHAADVWEGGPEVAP